MTNHHLLNDLFLMNYTLTMQSKPVITLIRKFWYLSIKFSWIQQKKYLLRVKQLKQKGRVGAKITYIIIVRTMLQNIEENRMLKYGNVSLCSSIYCFHYTKPDRSFIVIHSLLQDVDNIFTQVRLIDQELWCTCN